MTTLKHHLMLKPNQLEIHPENIRLTYPEDEIQEMSESIRANDGVLHALLIVPSGKKGVWYVVDGNKRLMGARRLGKDCPLLKCEPVNMTKGQQLLAMAATLIRSDPSAVDEGMHYRKLVKAGLSVRDISKGTGVYELRIRQRLHILDLDEPILKHVAAGKLPHGDPVVDAFLTIPDAKLRIRLANRLAKNPNVTTKTIQDACRRLRESLGRTQGPKLARPAVELAGADGQTGKASYPAIRAAARRTCAVCSQRETLLRDAEEPAWSFITHEAGAVCGSCTLKNVQDVCNTCPATELLRRLMPAGKR